MTVYYYYNIIIVSFFEAVTYVLLYHLAIMSQNDNLSNLQGDFVAAFAQSNEGDVSPNTKGPHCIDTGLPCDTTHSTCNGNVCQTM